MSSTLKHLRIHCNRWLIYSNELKFAFFYHIKITVIVELTDGQSLTDCSLLEGKRNITPLISGGHAWPCSSSFRSFSPFISSSGILSLSLSLSFFAVFLPHYCFGLCLKSTEILIWMPEVSILHIPLTTKVFFCISSVKGSKVSLHNEDNLKMVQF